MNKKNKLFLCVTFVLTLVFYGYADVSMAERYLTASNEEYSVENYEKAYNYINSALQLYTVETLSDNVILFAEDVYYAYLTDIQARKDMDAFAQVKEKLDQYSFLASDRITLRIKAINNIQVQALSLQVSAATDTGERERYEEQVESLRVRQDEELQRLEVSRDAELKRLEDSQKQMFEHLDTQTDKFSAVISESVKQAEANNSTVLTVVLGIGALLVLVCGIIVVFVISANKNSKKQQEQFEATLQMVAQMNNVPRERIMIGGVTDLYGDNVRSAGSSRWGVDALPEPEQTDEDKILMADVAEKCERLGAEISFATGRKNNAKNVSELVYKLAVAMGVSNTTCMVYFCAAMVYDVGFLEIDKDLLQAESLTDDQKYEVRSHVQKGVVQLDFVPERYKGIFIDAATLHHENLDGSGYPNGLSGDQIPIIARLIRVSETFVALISKRIYRGIMDKESAIEELRRQGAAVDQSIVDVLDSLV